MTLVRTEAIGDVLLIEIHNPPINAGSLGVPARVPADVPAAAAGHGFRLADLTPLLTP